MRPTNFALVLIAVACGCGVPSTSAAQAYPNKVVRVVTPWPTGGLIGLLSAQTGLLVVHPSLPVKNVKELIAFARARPDEILYATSGSGSFSHLAIALLTSMTKTRMTHAETAARIKSDYEKYGYLIKLTGTRLE